ncbi:hypothetical protein PENANT_c074G06707 [Penicillium antarcticum]|uniref:SnoaL-like domain-containing protein n=1 Tax=Penicillium antarcticum TaxID=416450 RepID=A0A1V6PPB7_9EURO|nr:uncharacterized protein N7508_001946 [Penicillium antarcticum]KAJ5317438.1 hypothetical protein N7508_001946 [Penicillium antarcticum]OQD78875.1 hypothetical protein PENANT_c074G06707 [Penicillium antarcticum]
MLSLTRFVLGFLSCLYTQVTATADHKVEAINTSYIKDFHCPATTHAHLIQDKLQAAMDRFAYHFYVEKDVDAAFNKYVASNYVQHDPNILDGRDAAIESLSPLFGAKGNTFEIARVMVGPEYTTIHIKALTDGQPPFNVFDVYRTIGSCIVEHWDCMKEIVNNTASTHPYF